MLFLTGATDGPGPIRRFLLPAIFVAALFVAVFVRRPEPQEPTSNTPVVMTLTGPTMGTTYTVKIVGLGSLASRENEIEKAITTALDRVNQAMSTYVKTSEISQFNAQNSQEPFTISADFAVVLKEAKSIYDSTQGAFDPTVGPLVNLWGFGPDGKRDNPTEADIDAVRTRVGMKYLDLNLVQKTIRKKVQGLAVDLSAIAKGYGVDQVAEALNALQLENYLVEVGGELRSRGLSAQNRPWRVGIEKPVSNSRHIQEVIFLQDQAMATSGDYRNYRVVDGRRLSHTIDPRTGSPVNHTLASVTVLAPNCLLADGWATALNVLGPDAGLKYASQHKIAALFIIRKPDGDFQESASQEFVALRAKSKRNKREQNMVP